MITKDMPIRSRARLKINTLRNILIEVGKPMFYHFISSGSGALDIYTLAIGNLFYKSYYLVQKYQSFQCFLLSFYMYSLALEYLNVTKMMLKSYS